MIYRLIIALLACFIGSWMLIDGIHCMARGKYIGPEKPGPWSNLFVALGVNPFKLGPLFVVFGILWIGTTVFVLMAPPSLARPVWMMALAVACASLWYLPIGTVVSVIYILLLLLARSQLMGPAS